MTATWMFLFSLTGFYIFFFIFGQKMWSAFILANTHVCKNYKSVPAEGRVRVSNETVKGHMWPEIWLSARCKWWPEHSPAQVHSLSSHLSFAEIVLFTHCSGLICCCFCAFVLFSDLLSRHRRDELWLCQLDTAPELVSHEQSLVPP